jgi:hypothetical protein
MIAVLICLDSLTFRGFRSLQMGDQNISLASFRQMCGRAGKKSVFILFYLLIVLLFLTIGRTGLDSHGEAILILGNNSNRKERDYCEYLLTGELEPLKSSLHLGNGGGIEKLLLEMISCGRLREETAVMDFIRCTLMNTQVPGEQVMKYVTEAMVFLKKEQFVLSSRTVPTTNSNKNSNIITESLVQTESKQEQGPISNLLYVSPFGKATSLSGIPPKDAPIILQSLLQAKRQLISLTTGFHLLYLITPISCTIIEPDWSNYENFYLLFHKEFPEMMKAMSEYLQISPSLIQSFRFQKPSNTSPHYSFYKRFYLTMVLFLFIQEWPLMKMMSVFSSSSTSVGGREGGSNSNNNNHNSNGTNGTGLITRGQLQQLQKEITIYCSMIILFCEKCNWTPLAILLSDLQSKLLYYSGGFVNESSRAGGKGGVSGGKELLNLLKIGKEITFIRAKYFLEKYSLKNAMDLMAAGEEKITDILIEMLPFHEKITFFKNDNNNNELEKKANKTNNNSNNKDRMSDSCKQLARQIIYRSKQFIREEIRRKEEED